MKDVKQFSRFIGLRLPTKIAREYRQDRTNSWMVDEIEVMIHTADMGETCWMVPVHAQAVCVFATSRWDNHGTGKEEFDFYEDPLEIDDQTVANIHDFELLAKVAPVLFPGWDSRCDDIRLVMGWTDEWPTHHRVDGVLVRNEHCPLTHEGARLVAPGPWIEGADDDDGVPEYVIDWRTRYDMAIHTGYTTLPDPTGNQKIGDKRPWPRRTRSRAIIEFSQHTYRDSVPNKASLQRSLKAAIGHVSAVVDNSGNRNLDTVLDDLVWLEKGLHFADISD